MRDYIPKKWKIEKDVFMQIKYRLKRYSKIKAEFINLKNKNNLSRKERKHLKAIETEISGIDSAVSVMLDRYSAFIDKEFKPVDAYFSYEHYNLHIKRSGDPDDLGAGTKKWAEFKREFTAVLKDKLDVV